MTDYPQFTVILLTDKQRQKSSLCDGSWIIYVYISDLSLQTVLANW